jgi:hypothetical protein
MSKIGLVSLICAATTGVVGTDASSAWTWGMGTFITFLMLAGAAFVGSTLQRPSLLWEVVDDVHGKRLLKLGQKQDRNQ